MQSSSSLETNRPSLKTVKAACNFCLFRVVWQSVVPCIVFVFCLLRAKELYKCILLLTKMNMNEYYILI